jgi:uncharacterized lipoprotein
VKSEKSGEHMKAVTLVFNFAFTLLTAGCSSDTTKASDQDNARQTSPAKNMSSITGRY